MIKRHKKLVAFLIVVVLASNVVASTITRNIQATYRDIQVMCNGEVQPVTKEPFIVGGAVYMSIRDIANILDVQIDWTPSNNTIQLLAKPDLNQCPDTSNDNHNNNNSNAVPDKDLGTLTKQEQYESEVLRLTNVERAKYGLDPLTLETTLTQAARLKTNDLIQSNYFAHESPTYGSASNMLKTVFGITGRSVGENLGAGYVSPEAVVQGWMNSSGHRANILRAEFTRIGIGYGVNSSGKQYWTQIFTS